MAVDYFDTMYSPYLFVALCASCAWAVDEDRSQCDPTRKDEHCPPDPGFAGAVAFDFSSSSSWDNSPDNTWVIKDEDLVKFHDDDKALEIKVEKEGQEAWVSSRQYLFFGKVTFEVEAAAGQGIVTALVLKSDSGDEIDWELLGASDKEAQTNYFHDGDAVPNTYNTTYAMNTTITDTHVYGIEWTDETLVFSIDDVDVKTWRVGQIPRSKWPQTPMFVALRLWTITSSDDPGLVTWGGGQPSWDSAPFTATIHRVEIEDYAGGCREIENRVEYFYDEHFRAWEDVQVSGCKGKPADMLTPSVPSGTMPPMSDRWYESSTTTASGDESTGEPEAPPKDEDPDDGSLMLGASMGLAILAVVAAL
ncbi:cell wall glucanosyltransferase Mwg1 [Emericellopsis atlantica]|uniref:Cell wall glucanosyltransferase Mwg1 n=1 Tax=Emericellopsis atlantica TaxID=2614577 RepID=A0A9P7ZFH8_9HYPO|nr:cell wall glucanosyltransferase Mwg1 [Emericellopsis atlantica]KAG9251194.1 cell wall glucanosyltransferase Mwg1 [Emericellopsis atlantica]